MTRAIALTAAAASAVVTGVLVALPAQVVDVPKLQDEIRPGADIRVTREVVHLEDQGYSMATPDKYTPTAEQLSLMTDTDLTQVTELAQQIRAAGGADLDQLSLRLLLEGRSSQEIRVVDIEAVDIKREPPYSGTLFSVPPEAGPTNLQMIFNLDESFPRAREAVYTTNPYTPEPGALFFSKTSIPLPDRHQELVVARFRTEKNAVSFAIRIAYVIGGERRQMTIDDNGKPFRVTSSSQCSPDSSEPSYDSVYELGIGAGHSIGQVTDPTKYSC